MPVSTDGLTRFVVALDAAAGRANESLRQIRTPGIRDLQPARALLDEATAKLSGISDELAGGSWLELDAARAADDLRAAIGTVRRARSQIASPRVVMPLRDAISGAGIVSRRVEVLARDAEAVARGDVPALSHRPTRAGTTAELQRLLVGRTNDELSTVELLRVGLLAELPESMRPVVSSTRRDAGLTKLALAPDAATERFRDHAPIKGGLDAGLNDVRLALEAPVYAAEPGLTRAVAEARLVDRLLRPNRALGGDDLRELALIASLPDGLRPSLPEGLDQMLRRAYVHGFQPRHQLATYVQFQDLRRLALDELPDEVATQVAARVAADEPVSSDVLAWLADADDATLARHGLSREHLLARTLAMVGDGKADGWSWGREQFHAARRLVDQVTVDPELRPLLEDLRRRLDEAITSVEARIVDRPELRRMDAIINERWPDFGEVGRAQGTAELIHQLRATQPSVAADSVAW